MTRDYRSKIFLYDMEQEVVLKQGFLHKKDKKLKKKRWVCLTTRHLFHTRTCQGQYNFAKETKNRTELHSSEAKLENDTLVVSVDGKTFEFWSVSGSSQDISDWYECIVKAIKDCPPPTTLKTPRSCKLSPRFCPEKYSFASLDPDMAHWTIKDVQGWVKNTLLLPKAADLLAQHEGLSFALCYCFFDEIRVYS